MPTGDACVPLVYAHLEGAEQITLDGVFHSVDKPQDWYGAEDVVDRWLGAVLKKSRLSSSGIGTGGGVFSSFPELESISGRIASLFSFKTRS